MTDISRGIESREHLGGYTDEVVDKFCPTCGAPVILACERCGAPLKNPPRGAMVLPGHPPFCPSCGGPFPWATRDERARQLVTILEHEALDDATRLTAIEAIDELVEVDLNDEDAQVEAAERVRTTVGARIFAFMTPVLQSVLTAAAKERLGLP